MSIRPDVMGALLELGPIRVSVKGREGEPARSAKVYFPGDLAVYIRTGVKLPKTPKHAKTVFEELDEDSD